MRHILRNGLLALALVLGLESAARAGHPGWFGFNAIEGWAMNKRFIGAWGVMPNHLGHEPLYDWTPFVTHAYGYGPYQPYVQSAFHPAGAYTWAYPVYPTWHGGYPVHSHFNQNMPFINPTMTGSAHVVGQ